MNAPRTLEAGSRLPFHALFLGSDYCYSIKQICNILAEGETVSLVYFISWFIDGYFLGSVYV